MNELNKPSLIYVPAGGTCSKCHQTRLSRKEEDAQRAHVSHHVQKITTSTETENAVDQIMRHKIGSGSPTSLMAGALTASFRNGTKTTTYRFAALSGGNMITNDDLNTMRKNLKSEWRAANIPVPIRYEGYDGQEGRQNRWQTVYGKPVDIPVQVFYDWFAPQDRDETRRRLLTRSCSAMKLLLCLGETVRTDDSGLWKATDITLNMCEEFYRGRGSKSSEDIRLGRTPGLRSYISKSCPWCQLRFPYLLCDSPLRQRNRR